MPERRRHPRYRLWLPGTLATPGDEAVDVVGHDMSRQGALLVASTPFAVGAEVVLDVALPPGSDQRVLLRGSILRCADNHEDPDGLWPHEIAVEFAADHPEVETQLRALLVAFRADGP